jgi:hypothetical protein
LNAQVGDQWRIAQAERVREAMGQDFCAIADELRLAFGAKLTWFECPAFSMGQKFESEPIGETAWKGGKRVA